MTSSLEERILENIELSDSGCWLWTLYKNQDGYGQIAVGRSRRGAHRVAYETFIGPVPGGYELDHLCRVRHCVNPEHLECVTHKVNVLRGVGPAVRNASKTHCPQGHLYAGVNLIICANGARRCRTCARAHWRKGTKKYKARKRAEKRNVQDV